MSYTMEVRDGRYIHVIHDGELTFHGVQEIRKQFSELAKTSGIHNILYDGSALTGSLSTYENFELSSTLRDFLPPDGKFALISRDVHAGDAQFSEDVITNRGINMRVFPDEHSALRWLLQEE